MFNQILRNASFGRLGRSAPRPYGKVGGGLLLPALAYFGWKYRDEIREFVSGKMNALRQQRQPASGQL